VGVQNGSRSRRGYLPGQKTIQQPVELSGVGGVGNVAAPLESLHQLPRIAVDESLLLLAVETAVVQRTDDQHADNY
jgi:hypothetical protein